jgi:acyl dehydratase
MTGLYFEDYQPGEVYTSVGRTVTETDIVLFTGLSGDRHQLHTDESWVQENTAFGGRIAHGPLGLAMAMGLTAQLGLSEGTTIAFLGIEEWNFKGPIRIGNTVHVEMEIADKRATSKPGRGVVTRTHRLINQDGVVVQEGRTLILVRARPGDE